jgi:cell division protein FtsB
MWWPLVLACAYLAILAVGLCGRDHGLAVWWQLKMECADLRNQITSLKADNKHLSMERHRLQTDYHYVEKIAREELQMTGDREVVFIFPDQ